MGKGLSSGRLPINRLEDEDLDAGGSSGGSWESTWEGCRQQDWAEGEADLLRSCWSLELWGGTALQVLPH